MPSHLELKLPYTYRWVSIIVVVSLPAFDHSPGAQSALCRSEIFLGQPQHDHQLATAHLEARSHCPCPKNHLSLTAPWQDFPNKRHYKTVKFTDAFPKAMLTSTRSWPWPLQPRVDRSRRRCAMVHSAVPANSVQITTIEICPCALQGSVLDPAPSAGSRSSKLAHGTRHTEDPPGTNILSN